VAEVASSVATVGSRTAPGEAGNDKVAGISWISSESEARSTSMIVGVTGLALCEIDCVDLGDAGKLELSDSTGTFAAARLGEGLKKESILG
jgi:hypothetical protein